MKTTTAPLILSLQEDPKLRILSWTKSVDNRAASLCTQYYPKGLLHFGITIPDARWDAMHPPAINPDDPDADPVPVPRPELQAPPDELPGNNQGQVYNRKVIDDRYNATCEAIALLKNEIIVSLGPTIAEEIEDLTEGFHELTVLEIVTAVTERYGTINEKEVRQLRAEMKQPFTAGPQTLAQQITNMRKRIQLLDHAGQPLSQADQMFLFEKATAHLANVQRSIQGYKDLNPALQDQSFFEMTKYAVDHEFTSPTANAYVAKTTSLTNVVPDIAALVAAEVAKVVRRETPLPREKRSRNGNKYCLIHGSNNSHYGTECRIMAGNNLFTDAQRNLRAPPTANK